MVESAAPTQLEFVPPGPGPWELDRVHFPRPATRYFAETHPAAFDRGFEELGRFYGLPMGGRASAFLNGFCYSQMLPVAPEEMPARLARAQEVFEGKLWREQITEWDEVAKPASIAAHHELQAVDPELLPDAELAEHLTRCRDHHARMMYQHARFSGAAMIPPGDLLAHVGEWTGLPPQRLLGMMRGASPVSGGVSDQLDRLVGALREDAAARALLESGGDPAKVLANLREHAAPVGPAMSAYLDFAGYRLLDGFDISGRYALEMPDALLRAIRSSVAGRKADRTDVAEAIAEVREQVPDQRRAQFDELLAEARLGYRIRDERGVFSDIWAAGLMRRAALAAGRRLAARGVIADAEHFVHAGFDEMLALLAGTAGPDADELARRYEFFRTHTAREAPEHLGPPAPPPPDISGLPPAAARMLLAMGIVSASMFAGSEQPHEARVIRGLSASGGSYEGLARRVAGPADFDRIRQGDVLLTESTSEAFNILLPLLGAVVTDSGGLLSHAAIIAREYGIPGVVGTRDATQRVEDGARVRVDGDAGEVTVLE